jgi:hypothetical protein
MQYLPSESQTPVAGEKYNAAAGKTFEQPRKVVGIAC